MRQITQWLQEVAEADRGTGSIAEAELNERLKAMETLQRDFMRMDGVQFSEAMTTAHFTTYFGTALSRAFYDAYEYQHGSWPRYTYADIAPDFRDVSRGRMSQPGTLYLRREKEESKATHVEDLWINYGVQEYSRQFDISWQTILNDDLGEIKRTPERMAIAARRFEDGFVSALYDNATTQAALVALGAVYAGTGRLTAANLAIGLNAMLQRVDTGGEPVQVSNIYLVIPPVLQIQAADILRDLLQYGGAGGNVLASFVAGVFVDPYITVGAGTPWYLFAAPGEIPTVTVVRLNGWPGPVVAMKRSNFELITGSAPAALLMGSIETGDIEYQVLDVIGGWDDATYVGVTDFCGIYYSSGTTP
jgi:hypothetical protein